MKKLSMLFFMMTLQLSFGQMIKGVVIDSLGNPIDNAYLINTTSQWHAHSDEFGVFALDKSSVGDIILVTALGYKKQEIAIPEKDFKIVLQSNALHLNEVIVSNAVNPMNVVSKIDLQTTPVRSSQDILRKVPGLFIGQHAGGGKAEQIFLRGFDIDHGTDIAISVDGMPVNMVSHAHGQGYADLHFVIPELIDKIDFGKGTYYANKGDFATAGYVSFLTKEKLENNSISVEAGQFNSLRTLGIFHWKDASQKGNFVLASEYVLTDGPFDSPQNFKRMNVFGKYTTVLEDKSKISFSASHFTSRWFASGQIPERLVENGTISRFGAVDNTEGGNTTRTNFNFSLSKVFSDKAILKSNAFYSHYGFELYSNFTFFLIDPINGDQIRQKEIRDIYGLNAEITNKFLWNNENNLWQAGLGFRDDQTNNTELSHTLNRYTTLEQIKLGNIDQTNIFSYLNAEFNFQKFKVNPSLRMDYFKFGYEDKIASKLQPEATSKTKVSPKLNLIYTLHNNVQFFLKSGFGFHSNDTRVVVSKAGKDILPTAFGSDLGTVLKPFPKAIVNLAFWYLQLQQEFVYVGDAGIVEPSGRSRRKGIDFGLRYQLSPYLFFDTDLNYTHARSIDESAGQNYIPLAPDFTSTTGLSLSKYKGFSGSFRMRYLKTRPANEDYSIVAKGYTVSDASINYQINKISFSLSTENIFNTKWKETQFATESRLRNENSSVEEIHFTPGSPLWIKAKICYIF